MMSRGAASEQFHDSGSPFVLETTADRFEKDVFEASQDVPIIVDFWATWCQPCRLLAPVLEQVVNAFAGRVRLVKANVDQVPELAAAFGVQGVPAVFAVVNRKIVDGFLGMVAEEALREWLSRVVTAAELDKARLWEESDPEKARTTYERIYAEQPQRAEAAIGLARLALKSGDYQTARKWIDQLAQRGYLEPDAEKIRAAIQLHDKLAWDLDALRREVEQQPQQIEPQIRLAEALAAHQQYEEALERLLHIVERQRGEARDRAREAMLEIFRALPDDSPLVSTYRRRLATALY